MIVLVAWPWSPPSLVALVRFSTAVPVVTWPCDRASPAPAHFHLYCIRMLGLYAYVGIESVCASHDARGRPLVCAVPRCELVTLLPNFMSLVWNLLEVSSNLCKNIEEK